MLKWLLLAWVLLPGTCWVVAIELYQFLFGEPVQHNESWEERLLKAEDSEPDFLVNRSSNMVSRV